MNKQIIFPLLFLLSGVAQAAQPLANLFVVPELERHNAPDFVSENVRGGKTGLANYKGKVVYFVCVQIELYGALQGCLKYIKEWLVKC